MYSIEEMPPAKQKTHTIIVRRGNQPGTEPPFFLMRIDVARVANEMVDAM